MCKYCLLAAHKPLILLGFYCKCYITIPTNVKAADFSRRPLRFNKFFLLTNWIINQSGDSEFMPVSLTLLSDGIQKMNMPSISDRDSTPCSSFKFMKMIFIEICPEFYFVNMVAHSDRDYFVGYSRKPVIVRVRCGFSDLNAAKHLMNVSLRSGTVWIAFKVP